MRIKWHSLNESSDNFSERPTFSPKSSWKPPLGHPNLEMLLGQVVNELFEITKEPTCYSNLVQDDRSIVITKADKGSCIVIWDRDGYLREAEKQFSSKNMYQEVQFKKQMLSNLVDTRPKKVVLFPEIGRVKFFYHSHDRIVECVSEYIFLIKITKK